MIPSTTSLNNRRKTNKIGLLRVLRNGTKWLFEEIKQDSEKQALIVRRHKFYADEQIGDYSPNHKDPFDDFARFFVLREKGSEEILKSLKIVTRDNPLRIIPLELNLMNARQLMDFSKSEGYSLIPSTLSDSNVEDIQKLLERNSKSKTYEVGGFFGNGNGASSLALVLGMAKLYYEEDWKFLVQTQHPKHAKFYCRVGISYKVIGGDFFEGYEDICQRPATTLGIEDSDFFQNFYENQLKSMAELIELRV